MKKTLLLLVAACTMLSCSKDDQDKLATVEVTLSYYYNQYQGYRPDVDANVYLFKDNDQVFEDNYIDYVIGRLTVKNSEKTVYADFRAKTDVNGVATINNVPYGKYLIVVSSKGRFVYSKKKITINSEFLKESKNFGYLRELDDLGEPW